MITAPNLEKGDTILLLSPAGNIGKEDVFPTVKILEEWGLNVKIAPHSFDEHYRFAGTQEERLSDFQSALDDANIKAILCNRGGYGSIHLVDKLKYTAFKIQPKLLIGFSDITIFHSYFNTILKCESLHAPMPVTLSATDVPAETLENFRKALFGEKLEYHTAHHPLNIFGETKGELVGGNLATLYNLIGTSLSYTIKGKILFIEDIDEPIHKIDQMLLALKFSGKLANLNGLIVGGFTNIEDNPEFGKTVFELIHDIVKPYNYPVVFNFPVGHIHHNYPLFIGRKTQLSVDKNGGNLAQ